MTTKFPYGKMTVIQSLNRIPVQHWEVTLERQLWQAVIDTLTVILVIYIYICRNLQIWHYCFYLQHHNVFDVTMSEWLIFFSIWVNLLITTLTWWDRRKYIRITDDRKYPTFFPLFHNMFLVYWKFFLISCNTKKCNSMEGHGVWKFRKDIKILLWTFMHHYYYILVIFEDMIIILQVLHLVRL